MTEENNNLIPKQVLLDILSHRLNIIADPQHGKTNLSRVLVAEMVKQLSNVQVKVFDTTQVYRHNFLDTFKCQEINNDTQKVFDDCGGIVFDIEYMFSQRIAQFIGNVVLIDYQRNRERKKASNGKLNDWTLYVLEEAQNSLNTHALNRLDSAVLLKSICEAANFGLSYIFIGQRAQDISTKAIERSSCYFIGKTVGDNNVRKLKGIVGKKAGIESKDGLGLPIHERAQKLEVGQFIFWNGSSAWTFKCPKFEVIYPNQRPQLVSPPKKRWSQIF